MTRVKRDDASVVVQKRRTVVGGFVEQKQRWL